MAERVLPKTVGAAQARNTLRDFVMKHAPDRPWGARGQLIQDTQNPGKLGLQISGDPGYFPVGTWAWLRLAGLDPLNTVYEFTPLETHESLEDVDVTDTTGTGDQDETVHTTHITLHHTHKIALPDALAPPQLGDEVFVVWMDKDAQQPLVLGKIEWSH